MIGDLVAGHYFFALLCFNGAIERDQAVGDGLLGIAAGLDEAGKFQELAEFDGFGTNNKRAR